MACADEVGRGSLAGPVTACAVVIIRKNPKSKTRNIREICGKFAQISAIKDSKQLSPKKREEFYKVLTKHPQILWAVASVSPKMIDKINIFEATKLAMKKAVEKLNEKISHLHLSSGIKSVYKFRLSGNCRQDFRIEFLILDGKMKLDLPVPQKSIVKADEKVFSCAAASIIAKVLRDRLMVRYHKKYPQYRFDSHKGYPTGLHKVLLKKLGPCEIHRKSFRPVSQISNF